MRITHPISHVPITSLPPELIVEITKSLDDEDLGRLACVHPRFSSAMKADEQTTSRTRPYNLIHAAFRIVSHDGVTKTYNALEHSRPYVPTRLQIDLASSRDSLDESIPHPRLIDLNAKARTRFAQALLRIRNASTRTQAIRSRGYGAHLLGRALQFRLIDAFDPLAHAKTTEDKLGGAGMPSGFHKSTAYFDTDLQRRLVRKTVALSRHDYPAYFRESLRDFSGHLDAYPVDCRTNLVLMALGNDDVEALTNLCSDLHAIDRTLQKTIVAMAVNPDVEMSYGTRTALLSKLATRLHALDKTTARSLSAFLLDEHSGFIHAAYPLLQHLDLLEEQRIPVLFDRLLALPLHSEAFQKMLWSLIRNHTNLRRKVATCDARLHTLFADPRAVRKLLKTDRPHSRMFREFLAHYKDTIFQTVVSEFGDLRIQPELFAKFVQNMPRLHSRQEQQLLEQLGRDGAAASFADAIAGLARQAERFHPENHQLLIKTILSCPEKYHVSIFKDLAPGLRVFAEPLQSSIIKAGTKLSDPAQLASILETFTQYASTLESANQAMVFAHADALPEAAHRARALSGFAYCAHELPQALQLRWLQTVPSLMKDPAAALTIIDRVTPHSKRFSADRFRLLLDAVNQRSLTGSHTSLA